MKLDIFINRPVLSTVFSVFFLLLGLIGLTQLPVSQYPDIAPPTIQVVANYPGASAQTVMSSVIAPIEEQINGVENMDYISSTASNDGRAILTVCFKHGTDPDIAAVNVQNRVAMAEGSLPAEVIQMGITTFKRQSSLLYSFAMYDTTGRYDQSFIENYMDINVIPEIKRIKGVGTVEVHGSNYAMRIWLKPEALAQYHLEPNDITAALADQNIDAAPGKLGENGNRTFQYVLRYKGRLQTVTEFENIVVAAKPDGEVLRLKDVAKVELGRFENTVQGTVDGKQGTSCMVFQMAGSNATETINNITDYLNKSKKDFPPGLKLVVMMDNNEFLYASIHEVAKTLLEAFVLVFIVTYIFLQNMRTSLIPTIAIPVALVGTFFFLWVAGFSINLLTLCALILAIAIVVDDAIVVVEAVQAKLDMGYKSAKQASLDAMQEISGAIVSITMVMMAVFIPVSFMNGVTGVFYKQMGLTMAFAIAISAFNALTLSPALCAILLKPKKGSPEAVGSSFIDRFHEAFNSNFTRLTKRYKSIAIFFATHKWTSCTAVAVAMALFAILLSVTKTSMVPNEDQGVIFGMVTMPPGSSMENTQHEMKKLDSMIAKVPGMRDRTEVSGINFLDGMGSGNGMFICKMKNWDERGKGESVDDAIAYLYQHTPQVTSNARALYFAPPMVSGYSATNGFELVLQDKTGGDINKFSGIAAKFIAALNARPEISVAYTSFSTNFPQYMIDIDAAQCKKAGISNSQILGVLQGYYGGMYVSNFNSFGKLYKVMIQADPSMRTDEESLNQIMVRNGLEMVPVSQFVKLHRVYGPDYVGRFNLYTSINVNGVPAPGVSSGQAIKAIAEVAKNTLPMGYGYDFSGLTREEQKTGAGSTAIILGLVFVFIYLLLSAQYESYVLPLAVILSVPFGLAGSFIFALMTGAENNIYLQIALIMLIGLLCKNAILIVQYGVARRRKGMPIIQSAIDAACARLRPILMTSFALIIGLLPMMFAHGVGANGNSTLGAGAVGGMLLGMIFQLVFVPGLFVLFEKVQERIKPIKWDLNKLDAEATEQHNNKRIE